jgi:phosphoribosylglycinamide formyltransferase-1
MSERFVDEPLVPVTSTVDAAPMAAGEPGLPHRFIWRGNSVEVRTLLRSWHETGRCQRGSPEMYLRRHWFEIVTSGGDIMKIYFERQPRRGRKGARWWLFTVSEPGERCGAGEEHPATPLGDVPHEGEKR